MIGRTLGPYRILEKLGEGGMGEVYSARDTRLDRTVAIKVLPPDISGDPKRRARFEREAKMVARLSHPHICTLHDVGDIDGAIFLVMEYLVGETLAARLERGPLPLDEALATARQIAEALAAAHLQGVVHRDLKPGNVMLTASGATLLDFGLAKLRGHGDDATTRFGARSGSSLTVEGTIVGTLPYMAPEQIEGRPVDARADIWALGAVLHEMVTGQRAFDGGSAASLMASILRAEPPPLSSRQPLAPPALEQVVRTCLAKDPEARFQAAGDVARELGRVADALRPGSTEAGGSSETSARTRRRIRHAAIAAVAVGVVALAAAAWLWRSGGSAGPPPRLVTFTTMPGFEACPAMSPDGRHVAFVWTGENDIHPHVHVKSVGDGGSLQLTSGSGFEFCPAWSPDGGRIAFLRSPSGVFTASALGGDEQKLADVPNLRLLGGTSWSPDGRWLAVARAHPAAGPSDGLAGIYVVPVSGGDPVRVTFPRSPEKDTSPSFSWDRRFLAFARGPNEMSADLFVLTLTPGGAPSGAPRKLPTPAQAIVGGLTWARDSRSIVMDALESVSHLYRVWLDGRTPPERIELAGPAAARPSTSRALDRLVFVHMIDNSDVWRLDLGEEPRPILRSSFNDIEPQFSPDGRRLVFTSYRTGEAEIWTANADGSSPAQLTRGLDGVKGTPGWSPDGRWVVFDRLGEDGKANIYVIESGGGQPRRVTSGGSNQNLPSWSRDGRWIYFRSDRTGRAEIWRAPFGGGESEQMTTGGGAQAYESADGRTLFYTRPWTGGVPAYAGSELFARPLDGGPERRLVERVSGGVAVTDQGIYYLVREAPLRMNSAPLMFLDLATGRSTQVARIANPAGTGIAVSPDRKTILYTVSTGGGSDLMLIEGFR
jgi:eukaryotic-like serine/threonine-protein kinase